MLTFISVALTIYAAMHFYALSKVWLAFPHSLWLGLTLSFIGISMSLSPLILFQSGKYGWHSITTLVSWVTYMWMGFLFLFCCSALLIDISRLFCTLTGVIWPLNHLTSLISAGVLALSFLSYGLLEARQIQIEKITITTPKFSSAKITIAQISDLHLGSMLGDKFLDRVIAKLNSLQPDMVVSTGDLLDGQGDDMDNLARHFLTLQPPLGKYAITGNHEYYAGLENSLHFLRNAGFTVLRGEAVAAGGIILVGVDDPAGTVMGLESMRDTEKTLASAHRLKNDYTVFLKHQPLIDNKTPFDLQLSGHVHGGQIFPFGWLTRLAYGVQTGLTQLADKRLLYVSRGTGTWGPPIRLFAAPEITLITITGENQ